MKYEIINHMLYLDGKQVEYRPSPNHGGIIAPKFIVAHYTASKTAEGAISWMVSPTSKVSAQLHLDREGVFVQLTPLNIKAWHAGESSWGSINGLNSYSIGIECQNTGKQEYTDKQIDAFIEFSKVAVKTYPIKEILGHSDIAPKRKIDPGEQFPMEEIRDEVFQVNNDRNIAPTKKVTTELNLREGIGTSFKVITVLKKDTEVNILEEYKGWSQVFICGLNLKGWLNSQYLK